ncbi:MAG: MoaD/ThiS family protein [Polyangiaceae bacterium]|nr:MoaD/ThiS family protein [Polyangiaceae bacterium]
MLAFAGARDLIGAGELEIPLEAPCTAESFLDLLCSRFPALTPYRRSLRIAVNGVYALPEDSVTFGDEVAVIPPVAGG